MRTVLLSMLLAFNAQASWSAAPSWVLAQTPSGGSQPAPAPKPGPSGEDDEDEEDTAKPPDKTGVEGGPAAAATDKPAEGAVVVPTTSTGSATQKLVSGAPLFNPNVAVHIVQQKQFSDRGMRELALYPVALQVNGKFTQHYGTALSFVYHLHENFGFQATGQYNWFATESGFNSELINKVREQAQAATSLLLVWGAQGGVEVTPLYGKFAWYEDSLAHFSFVVSGGAGVGSTRHQLKPENKAGCANPPCAATFGETGMKFLGSLGAGFRLQLGKQYALRLEVRDLVYTARVDTVNGCNGDDLTAMDRALRAGQPATSASVRPSCRAKETFDGVDPRTGLNRANDVPLALELVKVPSSDALNNVGFYAGFAVLF